MNKKLKVLILAGNTLRARAYAQYLAKENLNVDVVGLFFGFKTKDCSEPILDDVTKSYFQKEKIFIPEFQDSLETIFSNNNWKFDKIDTIDVNSPEVIDKIRLLNADIVVFAGYGGQILSQEHFNTNKSKYLHMHPGKLPEERGSTTMYYSILNRRKLTVTAFYMTAKIDDGKNVLFREYNVPAKDVDIDRWLDNVIRADCFIKALDQIMNNDSSIQIDSFTSEEYFVIHPVLKHVAMLSLK